MSNAIARACEETGTRRVLSVHATSCQPLVVHFGVPVLPRDILRDQQTDFEARGKLLANALLDHLPGGLIDALLCQLLKHKASLLVVPHGRREP